MHRIPSSAAVFGALLLSLGLAAQEGELPQLPPPLAEHAQQLRAAVSRPGAGAAAFGELAGFYHAHEFLDAAIAAYAEARKRAPQDPQWWYLAALAAEEDGDLENALKGYARAHELAPGMEASAVRLARLQRLTGENAAASQLLQAVLQTRASAAAQAELGQLALAAGHWQEAAARLTAALALQPEARTLHHPLAIALRNSGDIDGARKALDQSGDGVPRLDDPWGDAMRRQSRSAAFYMSQGLAAARSGNYPAALSLLNQAQAAEPDNELVLINLARAHENLGQPAQARQVLGELLSKQPDYAPAHLNLGVLDELAGDDRAALPHYLQATRNDPTLFQAQLLAANSALRLGRHQLAANFYEAALALRPERDELRFRQAVALTFTACGRAIGEALNLVRRLPEELEVLTLYIRAVASCPQAAPQDLQNALNAGRNLHQLSQAWPVLETRAMIEAAAGQFEVAVQLQEQVLELLAADVPEPIRTALRDRLGKFRENQIARQPFTASPHLTQPRRLTPADRN